MAQEGNERGFACPPDGQASKRSDPRRIDFQRADDWFRPGFCEVRSSYLDHSRAERSVPRTHRPRTHSATCRQSAGRDRESIGLAKLTCRCVNADRFVGCVAPAKKEWGEHHIGDRKEMQEITSWQRRQELDSPVIVREDATPAVYQGLNPFRSRAANFDQITTCIFSGNAL